MRTKCYLRCNTIYEYHMYALALFVSRKQFCSENMKNCTIILPSAVGDAEGLVGGGVVPFGTGADAVCSARLDEA